jgi:RNase H-like domain found in reverse transcriptase
MFQESLETFESCDLSGTCLEAILSEKKRVEDRTIWCTSRIRIEVAKKFSNTDQKLLAIVWAITKKFFFLIKNVEVKVSTYHKLLVGKCKLFEKLRKTVSL